MGRPKRSLPFGRFRAWLRLCHTDEAIKKLLPIYFPNIPIIKSGMSEPEETKVSSSVSSNISRSPKKIIKNNILMQRRMEQIVIDEKLTSELHELVDRKVCQHALRCSPVYWKSLPQLKNLKKKHPNAICGVYILKTKCKRPENSVLPCTNVDDSSRLREDDVKGLVKELSEKPSDSPVLSPAKKPFCRFCGSEDVSLNINSSARLTCENCKSFLNDTCSHLNRLEFAICIKHPTCCDSFPIQICADKPCPTPLNWCEACKLYHYVRLGYRPTALIRKKPENVAVLHYLKPHRLSKPSLICWARERRCVEFLSHQLNGKIDVQEDEQRESTELATFLDQLWCRVHRLDVSNPQHKPISSMHTSSQLPVQMCHDIEAPELSIKQREDHSKSAFNDDHSTPNQNTVMDVCELPSSDRATIPLTTGSKSPNKDTADPDVPQSPSYSNRCEACTKSTATMYSVTLGPPATQENTAFTQPEVLVCGSCVLQCRMSAVQIADQVTPRIADAVCWFLCNYKRDSCPLALCCTCSKSDNSCSSCHFVTFITLLRNRLNISRVLKRNEDTQGVHLDAIGSPLFFACCRALPEGVSKDVELYSRIAQKNSTANDQLCCDVCRTTLPDLFELTNGTIACQTCLLAYKAVLVLLGRQEAVSDVALLARLVALPCSNMGHEIGQFPLWAVCTSCHARRCLRLLHPLEPCLSLPSWLKRRARLVFFGISNHDRVALSDLNPAISISKETRKGSTYYNVRTAIGPIKPDSSKWIFETCLLPKSLDLRGFCELTAEERNALESDSSSSCASSSLRVLSDSESEADAKTPELKQLDNVSKIVGSEEEEEEAIDTTDVNRDSTFPKDTQIAALRNRRQRRLTAKYAEALEEQTRRRRISARRGSGGGNAQHPDSPSSPKRPLIELNTTEKMVTESASPTAGDTQPLNNYAGAERRSTLPAVKSIKRPQQSTTQGQIIEGKRKPKISSRLRDDYKVLGVHGKWKSLHSTSSKQHRSDNVSDGNRSDATSISTSGSVRDRRAHRRGRLTVQGRGGPRVKQVGRKPLESPYERAMSAMVHAAKLAAVGAQTKDGTSPLVAASTATAEAYYSDASSADGSSLRKIDCGRCAACRGVAQPCGRCDNCRLQAHYGNESSVKKKLICKETICFKRRHLITTKGDRPRVKLPSDFSPRRYQQATKSMQTPPKHPGPSCQPSLLETVPGLQEQLLTLTTTTTTTSARIGPSQSTGLTQSASSDSLSSAALRAEAVASATTNGIEVFADASNRSLRGGQLGMHFAAHDSTRDERSGCASMNKMGPVDGEVIDIDLAYQGGYPVVTTLAAAPPKEICYACGSGGGQLLFCVSCAEPFHFYCVERQFRPKKKDHFLCRNCTVCANCSCPASELRCIRCLAGFHPGCLDGYAPAATKERGKWMCPDCTHCLHCLVKPLDREVASYRTGDKAAILVPWSAEPSKCADCADAEARGQICPECDRAYLDDTMEMIQCDSCHLWRHRACAKLTSDQYDLIASAPPNRLRSFTIYCTVCKAKVAAQSSAADVDGDDKLRCLAKETLTSRMRILLDNCNGPPLHHPVNELPVSPLQPNDSEMSEPSGQTDDGFSTETTQGTWDVYNNAIPQVDGGLDDSPLEEPQPGNSPIKVRLSEPTFDPPSETTHQKANASLTKTIESALVNAWLAPISLSAPPLYARWLTEMLDLNEWITPRTLAYKLLARLIHKIDHTPVTAREFLPMRRLLAWLSKAIEMLFPWLSASETVREVRGLLRQARGALAAVDTFLLTTAKLELYELACSHVAVILDETRTRLAIQSYTYPQAAGMRTLVLYEKCIRWVNSHLHTYHPKVLDCSRRMEEAQDMFIRQRGIRPSCFEPRSVQEKLESRFEVKDEKWVEHWSKVEDRIVMQNFQRELFLKWQRILNDPIQSPIKNPHSIAHKGQTAQTEPSYHFGLMPIWETLEQEYTDRMLPVTPPPPVDLDDSDFETIIESRVRALPIACVIQEEKKLFSGCADDPRKCLLCTRNTDYSIEGRMIYIGSDGWVHVNCALWSNEVYEEDSGQLAGLSAALVRGGRTRCMDCNILGATMACLNSEGGCCSVVHFPCALRRRHPVSRQPILTADRFFFCSPSCHSEVRKNRFAEDIRNLRLRKCNRFYIDEEAEREIEEDDRDVQTLISSGIISTNEAQRIARRIDSDMKKLTLNEMLVCRRVFVPSDCFIASLSGSSGDQLETTDKQQTTVLSLAVSPNTLAMIRREVPPLSFVVTIGALRVDRLGHIAEASDSLISRDDRYNSGHICPIGYRARRIYWSIDSLGSRTTYTLNISQALKQPPTLLPRPNSTHQQNRNEASQTLAPSSSLANLPKIENHPQRATLIRSTSVEKPPVTPSVSFSPYSLSSSSTCANPTKSAGLPLIRFTYPQGVPPSRLVPKDFVTTLRPAPAISTQPYVAPHPTSSASSSATQHAVVSSSNTNSIPKTISPQSQSLVITNTPPAPAPPKFATIISPPANVSTPRIVSAISVPKSSSSRVGGLIPISLSNSITVYSISPSSQTSASAHTRPPVTQLTPIQTGLPQSIAPDMKRPSNIVRFVPASSGNACISTVSTSMSTAQQTHPPIPGSTSHPVVIRRIERNDPLHTPVSGASSYLASFQPRTIRVAAVATSAASPIISQPSTASGQYIIPKLADANLESELDGLFSNLKSPGNLSLESLPNVAQVSKSPKSTQSPNRPVRIPQISQLDGINDGGEGDRMLISSRPPYSRDDGCAGRRIAATGKRKWMLERENRLALNECVLKAKHALTDRMYQKEVSDFVDSFRLQFSVDSFEKMNYTPAAAWWEVVKKVTKLRTDQNLPHMIDQEVDGWSQFGLSHRHVIFLLEQLPGAFTCYRYRFQYHQYRINRIRETHNPPVPVREGAARLIPYTKMRVQKAHTRDPLGFLLCRANPAPQSCLPHEMPLEHGDSTSTCGGGSIGGDRGEGCLDAARQAALLVANSLNLPPRLHARTVEAAVAEATADAVEEAEDAAAAGRGRNQLSLSYQLKNRASNREARLTRVAVHPSTIHKRGLFALRSFRPDELICEYTGELIRNIICDRREIMYQSSGVDCYMFRIDNDWVVDATYAGNYARFINHSCQPNCDAKIIGLGDSNHIVIIAKRRILPGEELTYDYRFPKEADKLLCNCGRIGCRKYLN